MKKVLLFFAIMMMAMQVSASDVVFDTNDTWSKNYGTQSISCTKDGITLTIVGSATTPTVLTGIYFNFGNGGTATITVNAGTATVTGTTVANSQYDNFDLTGAGPWTCPVEAGRLKKDDTSMSVQVTSFTVHIQDAPAPAPLVATPSVTTFSTLDDLKNLTITFSGTVPQVDFEQPGAVVLAAADLDPSKMYAYAFHTDMWFYTDKVIVGQFTPNLSLPAAECDMALVLVGIFKGQEDPIPVSIHYTPAGSPAFVMDANTDGNTAKIFAKLGTVANVTINNLTVKGGKWNTICLPFDLSSSEIETAFGAGAEVAKLASSSYDAAEEALSLNFTSVTEMEAGDPYVIKVTADVANPTFADVTLATYECQTVTTDYASMKGDFDKHFLNGGDKNTWFISNNTFYYPSEDGFLAATKCWFNLLGEAQQSSTSAKAKSIRMNIFGSEATAIHSVTPATKVSGNEVYNLQGVRVSNPTKKGIYIRNGVKMVVK